MVPKANVNVNSAHMVGVALGPGPAELSHDFAQVLDVLILQNRSGQFGVFLLGSGNDAGIPHDLPSAALVILAAPYAVSSANVLHGILGVVVGRDHFGHPLSGDVGHLNLNPDSLLFHGLDLLHSFLVHKYVPLSKMSFSLSVVTYSL